MKTLLASVALVGALAAPAYATDFQTIVDNAVENHLEGQFDVYGYDGTVYYNQTFNNATELLAHTALRATDFEDYIIYRFADGHYGAKDGKNDYALVAIDGTGNFIYAPDGDLIFGKGKNAKAALADLTAEVFETGFEEGYKNGYRNGYEDGYIDGYTEGYYDGAQGTGWNINGY